MVRAPRQPIEETSGYDRFDKLRTELEGKIEKKLPTWVFTLVVGGLFSIVSVVLTYIVSQNSKQDDKINDVTTRILIIETERKNEIQLLPSKKR